MTSSKLVIAIGITALVVTVAFAAEDHNSSRSNLSSKIPIGGETVMVTQSYEFTWKIDAGGSKLSPADERKLLDGVFEQIRKDVLDR